MKQLFILGLLILMPALSYANDQIADVQDSFLEESYTRYYGTLIVTSCGSQQHVESKCERLNQKKNTARAKSELIDTSIDPACPKQYRFYNEYRKLRTRQQVYYEHCCNQ